MKIFITEIDNASFLPIGFAELPSFLVHFRSPSFGGVARFVPGSGRADDCEGNEFDVEISQDSLSEFSLTARSKNPAVEAMETEGSFRVHGVISYVDPITESNSNPCVLVAAGDATFNLTLKDLGDVQPLLDTALTFIVHGISFWDEAI